MNHDTTPTSDERPVLVLVTTDDVERALGRPARDVREHLIAAGAAA